MITLSPSPPFPLSPLLAALNVDPWILAFSAVTVAVTIWMGFRSARKSKTASDFFVAGRSVSVGWNASAISGEYLSAASFMGIAGMVMSSGYDALWYPVCYACGYLFLLLFIAGPLRRFGAYTIPDFAEGRFDSPVFRKIAVVFVLFIGFFYTMPQMKGAGVTLGYIFQDLDFRGTMFAFLSPHGENGEALEGLNYSVGVFLVGAVITLNVALGGMKGITLVQAFQYWMKMFAISVPIFVLMAVYGHYGKQVERQNLPYLEPEIRTKLTEPHFNGAEAVNDFTLLKPEEYGGVRFIQPPHDFQFLRANYGITPGRISATNRLKPGEWFKTTTLYTALSEYALATGEPIWIHTKLNLQTNLGRFVVRAFTADELSRQIEALLLRNGFTVEHNPSFGPRVAETSFLAATFVTRSTNAPVDKISSRIPLPAKAPADATWLNPFGPLTTKAAKNAAAAIGKKAAGEVGRAVPSAPDGGVNSNAVFVATARRGEDTAPYLASAIPLRAGLSPGQRMTVNLDSPSVAQALGVYAELTGRQLLPNTNSLAERADDLLGGKLSALKIITRPPAPDSGVREHGDGMFTAAEVKAAIEAQLGTNGLALVAVGGKAFTVEQRAASVPLASSNRQQDAGGTLAASAEKAWLAKHEKPLALLYTYSLIIAIVCGTAGLPHILVRFYTNPDGTAAKKTTMWVMVLIGVFYLFPPVFGVMGRNLLPSLYAGTGAKGTDKVVLELPRVVGSRSPTDPLTDSPNEAVSGKVSKRVSEKQSTPWGSILSGITCAGAFAAFMSTFSGLLVSMTGALAHDVYGRMLRPKSTPEQRMRMFKIAAVLIGTVAVVLGSFVEPLEINFMVGQAFAIAAASYFPLLFMSVWWRGMTMKGAATGMLAGGLCALFAVTLTNFSNLALDKGPMGKIFSVFAPLNDYWSAHPLARILCEQPAIWTVPLAILLMVVVSKLTAHAVPADIRKKMLVLHAPEQLGLKQEYIQEHQPH